MIPRFGQVVREQFRATALILRIPAMIVGAIALVATFLALADFFSGRGGVEFAPQLSLIPAFAGILLAVGVWHRDRPFGARFFWTLPVDRTRHALAKMLAGWLWLMIAAFAFLLWLAILALITKGNLTSDEMVRLLPTPTPPASIALDPSMIKTVRWIPHPAMWLVPFTASTGAYILITAITLGLKHPFRWIIGAFAAAFLFTAVGQGLAADAFWLHLTPITRSVMEGRYGLDAVLTARSESLHTQVVLNSGKVITAWRALPVVSDWIIATLLWTSIGAAGLSAALFRNRERR